MLVVVLRTRRVATVVTAAAVFGVAVGLLKGDDTGLRGAVGNLSAPWLLVAFLPALRAGSVLRGAAVGLVATVVALTGFYVALTFVLAGHLGGGGFPAELGVEVVANRVYFAAGLVSGPLLGAAGAWVGRRHGRGAWLVSGALLAGEIVAVAVAQGHQLAPPPFYFSWAVDDWRPYVAEALVGLAVAALGVARMQRSVEHTFE